MLYGFIHHHYHCYLWYHCFFLLLLIFFCISHLLTQVQYIYPQIHKGRISVKSCRMSYCIHKEKCYKSKRNTDFNCEIYNFALRMISLNGTVVSSSLITLSWLKLIVYFLCTYLCTYGYIFELFLDIFFLFFHQFWRSTQMSLVYSYKTFAHVTFGGPIKKGQVFCKIGSELYHSRADIKTL